ncbi:MAG: hypothetical protein V3S81_07765, partial [Anaerolineales bacterium]
GHGRGGRGAPRLQAGCGQGRAGDGTGGDGGTDTGTGAMCQSAYMSSRAAHDDPPERGATGPRVRAERRVR